MDLTAQEDTKKRATELANKHRKLHSSTTSFIMAKGNILTTPLPEDAFKQYQQHHKEIESTLTDIQKKCDSLWSKLQKKSSANVNNNNNDTSNVRIKILETKELLYKAELARQQLSKNEPRPPELVKSQLQDELELLNKQLTETIKELCKEVEKLESSLDFEQKALEEHKRVNTLLQNKVAEEKPASIDSLEKQLRKKDKQLNSDYANLMRILSAFLDEYYNPEADEESNSQNKKSESHYSLKYFLQELMNRLVTAPEMPYIRLDTTKHWGPYVELLIRSGIAEKHPKDGRLLKLVNFNE